MEGRRQLSASFCNDDRALNRSEKTDGKRVVFFSVHCVCVWYIKFSKMPMKLWSPDQILVIGLCAFENMTCTQFVFVRWLNVACFYLSLLIIELNKCNCVQNPNVASLFICNFNIMHMLILSVKKLPTFSRCQILFVYILNKSNTF